MSADGEIDFEKGGIIYADGSYLHQNPHWHVGDSAWKATHIATLLERNDIRPSSVCEVGCGAGEVLIQLSNLLPPTVHFDGYEISPDAHSICAPKSTDRINFHLHDLLKLEDKHFDVALAIDVFEHVEDYLSFLRKLRSKARYKVFHIPLELSALMVGRSRPLLHQRRTVGHLHHFSKETALATLEDTGYTVLDHFYTSGRTDLEGLGWKTRLLKGPRKALALAAPDAAARLLGGYSLLVVAE